MPRQKPVSAQRPRKYQSSWDVDFEKKISDAFDLVADGYSIEAAARTLGLKSRTLSSRLSGRYKSRPEATYKRSTLTPEMEKALLAWIEKAGSEGRPYDNEQIRMYVSELCGGKHIGKNWAKRFLKRHPEITKSKGTGLDPARGRNFNPPTISDYFDLLNAIYETYGPIPAEHIWNMDEKGIQMGGGRKKGRRKYYFHKNSKNKYHLTSDNLEMATVVECASAAGVLAPACFILKNGRLPHTPCNPDVGSIEMSESGWTDQDLAAKWAAEQFIPATRDNLVDESKPVILTIDGHHSHECDAIKTAIYEAAGDMYTIVIAFPSKCTHKLQPLDVGIFNQVQNEWSGHCDTLLYDAPIGKKIAVAVTRSPYLSGGGN